MNVLNYAKERFSENSTKFAGIALANLGIASAACAQDPGSNAHLVGTITAFLFSLVNATAKQQQFFKSSIAVAVVLLASMFGEHQVQLVLQAIAGGILTYQMGAKEKKL